MHESHDPQPPNIHLRNLKIKKIIKKKKDILYKLIIFKKKEKKE